MLIVSVFDHSQNQQPMSVMSNAKLTISLRSWMKNCFRLNDILTIFALQNLDMHVLITSVEINQVNIFSEENISIYRLNCFLKIKKTL